MSEKSSTGVAAATGVPTTEEAMVAAERQFIAELVQAMPAWYDQAGPGVDVSFVGAMQMIVAADKAAAPHGDAGEVFIPARWAAVQAMRGALKVTWPLSVTRRREQRKRALKQAGMTDVAAYERQTIELLAADMPAWYAKGGLWFVVRSLLEACKVVDEVFTDVAGDSKVPAESKLFVSAFEMRRRYGKVSEVELQALELIGNEAASAAA